MVAPAVWMSHGAMSPLESAAGAPAPVCPQLGMEWRPQLNARSPESDRTARTRAQHVLEHLSLILNSGFDLQTGIKQHERMCLRHHRPELCQVFGWTRRRVIQELRVLKKEKNNNMWL